MNIKNKEVHQKWQIQNLMCRYGKKQTLTVEEAAAYSGIGSQKLREMSDSEYCPFVLWNGAKRLIKREKLDKYLAEMYSI